MLPASPASDDPEQRLVAVGDVEAGEQHHRLARDRDAGAARGHQQEDPGEPGVVDDVDAEVDDWPRQIRVEKWMQHGENRGS